MSDLEGSGATGRASWGALALAALLLLAAGALARAAAAEHNWDMPTPYGDDHFRTRMVRWFVDELRQATDGRIEITVYDNASLFPMPEIKGAVQSGQVPIGQFLLTTYGQDDPIFEADTVPFLASGLEEAWRLYEVQKPLLERRLQAGRLRLLFSVAGPGIGFYSTVRLARAADFRGVKFRAASPTSRRLAALLGAEPVTIHRVGVRQAFAAGEIAAMLASPSLGMETGAWDYVRYFYPIDAMHPRDAVVVNERAFRRLAPELQSALLDVAARAETRGWELAERAAVEIRRAFAGRGLAVIEPAPEMTAELRAIGRAMVADWVVRGGPDAEAIVRALER